MTVYVTKDGDMLDAICRDYYGQTEQVTEWVLSNNPRLADLGMVYVAGVIIQLPPLPAALTATPALRLWD